MDGFLIYLLLSCTCNILHVTVHAVKNNFLCFIDQQVGYGRRLYLSVIYM